MHVTLNTLTNYINEVANTQSRRLDQAEESPRNTRRRPAPRVARQ
jgi:hypothetical protein